MSFYKKSLKLTCCRQSQRRGNRSTELHFQHRQSHANTALKRPYRVGSVSGVMLLSKKARDSRQNDVHRRGFCCFWSGDLMRILLFLLCFTIDGVGAAPMLTVESLGYRGADLSGG